MPLALFLKDSRLLLFFTVLHRSADTGFGRLPARIFFLVTAGIFRGRFSPQVSVYALRHCLADDLVFFFLSAVPPPSQNVPNLGRGSMILRNLRRPCGDSSSTIVRSVLFR